MGIFTSQELARANGGQTSNDPFHKLECRVCPLNTIRGNRHPHMEPTGAAKPTVYILGGYPDEQADVAGYPFSDEISKLLRSCIPPEWLKRTRFSNVVRTRPDGEPDEASLECCRPSVTRDVEQTKPRIILGLGNTVLHWATGQRGIDKWRGRRIPVKIGTHTCWFYSMFHPREDVL